MDTAILTEALASPELLQSVLEHFPSDLIEAELSLLPQAQQQRFKELRASLLQKPLKEGDIVRYTTPDNLQSCRVYEGLDLKIELILRGGRRRFGGFSPLSSPRWKPRNVWSCNPAIALTTS